ncbi:condensation domain-containing protein [Peribacillus frigoritolerans]|uniref:condensation domain-containing protein n=1 Tax=Peribacillus frigoritolerans TaxID=450367 RepID=UPI002EBD0B13|nr:condensation domain-containing protein [Peribacillus frigoritolerans]
MDIAIIGMSGVFPEAEDLSQFYLNLLNGIDSVSKLPNGRRNNADEEQSSIFGYLEQIDEFDYKFFNLSRFEAENMDPQQRLLLQLVCTAIENSGYSLEEYRGSKTSIIINSPGGPKPEYVDMVEKFHPTLLTGNSYAMYAGRISHFLGLRGPAMMVDTSCSSSLVALHESCNKLRLGEVDCAITGGVRLVTNQNYPKDIKFGIESESNRCKAFDDSADGIIGGEGGGILLLKPLDKAIQDRDLIHAVIKGSAVNQDGDRSNGITAPSPQAQTEVITEAWRRAKVDPKTISYIEAHGTGTHLGDPIEIQGITDAFNLFTDQKKSCYIGSLKTNIGHLSEAAGIASVIKTVLSLKNKKIFPSLHFTKPNTHIDFENSAVKVNTTLQNWDTFGEERRLAGVSSFGLSGTNCHVVLEEAPPYKNESLPEVDGPMLFTLSAKSNHSLIKYKDNLISYLKNAKDSMSTISYVLNKGRNDMPFRFACVAKNREELVEQLKQINETCDYVSDRSVIFLFSHEFQMSEQIFKYLTTSNPKCKEILNQILNIDNVDMNNDNVIKFISQYLLYVYWKSVGVHPAKVVGTGLGKLVVDLVTGYTDLETSLVKAEGLDTTNHLDKDKLRNLIASFYESENPVFLGMNQKSELLEEISNLSSELENIVALSSFKGADPISLKETQAELYVLGVEINWKDHYEDKILYRTELPTYPFEKQKCWLDIENSSHLDSSFNKFSQETESMADINRDEVSLTGENVTLLEKDIAATWVLALKLDQINVKDDFFDLGGNSLISIHIIEKLEETYHIELDFDTLFNYSTIRELSEYIDSLIEENQDVDTVDSNLPVLDDSSISKLKNYPLSYSQEGMWYLDHLEPGSSFYNIPFGIRLNGILDEKSLERSISEILARHESLRTNFPIQDGKPIASIQKQYDFSLSTVDLQDIDESFQEDELNRIHMDESLRPFDLATGPLFRAKLLKLNSEYHVLIITMHHIISDNWSFQILLNELVTLYQAFSKNLPSPLKKLDYQYSDFATWQRNKLKDEELKRKLLYWTDKLSGAPELLQFPTKKNRPEIQSYNGATCSFEIPLETISKLNGLCREEEVTLFITLLTSWEALLYRYIGQEDMVIGVPVAGRKVSTEEVIGNFVNSLAIRTDLSGEPTFKELLSRVKKEVLETFNEQDLPFNLIVDKLNIPRKLSYTPVYQIMFDFHHNSRIKDLKLPDLDGTLLEMHIDTVRCDLEMVIMNNQDRMEGLFVYNTDIFEEKDMNQLVEYYVELLKIVAENPDIQILDIPLSKDQNRKSVYAAYSDDNDEFQF